MREYLHPSNEADPVDPPRSFYDASLLFRRMLWLDIDRAWLAAEDPLLFRELQAFCTLCRSKRLCAFELSRELDDAGWAWCRYCPNAGTLEALGAAHNCGLAARHARLRDRAGTARTRETCLA